MAYYCHNCNRLCTVQLIGNNSFECTDCHGEFVEEMEEVQNASDGGNLIEGGGGHQMHHAPIQASMFSETRELDPLLSYFSGTNEIRHLLGSLMQQRNPPPSSSSTVRSRRRSHTTEPEDFGLMQDFMGQLLTNLIGNFGGQQGGQIHIQFGDGESGRVFHGNFGDYAWGEGGLDQIVTMLLNQFEGNARGISKDDLRSLPMTEVTDKQVENGSQCTTCMEAFNKGETVAQLECQHIFHRACIAPWLERNNTCPICRKEVDSSKWPKKKKVMVEIDELD